MSSPPHIKTILLLALLSAFPPLSTDMYLASIPLLVKAWRQPLAIVNLTLVGFFAAYCGFLLIYGPLADRYGRKKPLLVGLAIYICASVFCAMAANVQHLIIARILQGAGAASGSAVAFAICKDLFAGELRQRIFIQLGMIVATAPLLSPVIGGWIIVLFSWRLIFVLQAVLGIVAIVGVCLMQEPLREFSTERLTQVLWSYGRLMRNARFSLLTLALSGVGIPLFSFIAVSSDIYITGLGYSEKTYGYFFAFNASAFMIAPLVLSRMTRRFSIFRLLPISYSGVLISAFLLTLELIPQPFRLALPMWFLSFSFALGRPLGNNLILEQVEKDVGTASSLMVFVYFMTGACSMWLISLGWQDKVQALGILGTISSALTLGGWLAINRWLTPKSTLNR